MHLDVREEQLPGLGRRFTVSCIDGGLMTIVVHNTGRRDVYVLPAGSDDPSIVSLDEDKARIAGSILSGDYGGPPAVRGVQEIIDDLVIDWVALSPGSPGPGRSLADLGIGTVTGVTVMSILRGRATIHEPSGAEVLQPGDRLVVVGRREHLPAFRRLVAGR
jgi:K+:H+ antiporter subunit KhtT